jgi:predicted transcriptional regulator
LVGFKLSPELDAKLEQAKTGTGLSKSEIVEQAIEAWVQKRV